MRAMCCYPICVSFLNDFFGSHADSMVEYGSVCIMWSSIVAKSSPFTNPELSS